MLIALHSNRCWKCVPCCWKSGERSKTMRIMTKWDERKVSLSAVVAAVGVAPTFRLEALVVLDIQL